MRFIYSRFLAATTLTLLTLPQLTWAWTKDYSYEHKMGDNDSRNLAKEAAVEQIKLKAAQEAGTYIQGTTTLSNGQLEETITQIGASIVKVVVQSDKISVDDTGHQLLTVTANATVDETVMQERIKALREDANKAKLLQQLASENEKLRAEMTALAKQRVQELDSDKLAAIVAREATLRKDLTINLTSTEQVFTSVVSAIDIANQEALALKSEFDKIAAEWELNFFQPLRKPKITRAEVLKMKLSDDGQFYTGQIVIGWQVDPNKEVVSFVCQQQAELCKQKENMVVTTRADLLPNKGMEDYFISGFPASMSLENKSRFSKMIGSNKALYYIQYTLADRHDFVNGRIYCGEIGPLTFHSTVYGVFVNSFGSERDKECSNVSVVFRGDGLQVTNFKVSVDDMKNNPLLKVEVITREEYRSRWSTKKNFKGDKDFYY